jgi:hypothetical protein
MDEALNRLFSLLGTGAYATPIIIGGLFFEKNEFIMTSLIIIGLVLLCFKLESDLETAKMRRRFLGHGDLK